MDILHLIIAESALEVVVISGKLEVLDRSRHHTILRKMVKSHKRGRPDIVYLTLQVTQYSPINARGLLRTYIHTIDDHVIRISPETRIPHNYINFIGLIRQLYKLGRVPPQGKPLMTIERATLRQLIDEISPDTVILLDDVRGRQTTFRKLVEQLSRMRNPCVIIGGFPHGSFEDSTYELAHDIVRVGNFTYNTFLICAKLLTYLEQQLGIEE